MPLSLDDFIALKRLERDRQKQLMNAFEQAADVQPDKYAQQKELGEAARIDLEQLPGFEPEARRNKLFMDAGLNRLWEGAPVTAKWLSNPDNAKLASDSVQQLSGIESVFKRISEIPTNVGEQWQEGQLMTEQGYIGQRMQSGTSTMEDVRRIEEINERMAGLRGEKTIEGAVTQVLGQMSTTLPEALRFGGESAIVAGTVATVAGLAGPQVAAITVSGAALAAFFAGTTWKMVDQAYKIEAGRSYLEMINEGIDKDTAALASTGVGLVNAALELTGVGIVTAPIRKALTKKVVSGLVKAMTKPTKKQAFLNFGKAYLKAWSGETSIEFLQEVSSVAGVDLAKVLEGRESLLETEEGRAEIAGRLVDIVEQAGKAMSVLAFPGAAVQFNMDYSRAKAAQRQTEFFNELNDAVAENPLKKRSPAAFEEFLRAQTNGTPVENVFIDVDQFAQVLAQQGVAREALQQNIPEVAKQVDEAVAIGGDITIPTAKYAVHFAGTDLGNAMQPHLKISPEKMSQAEAQQFEQEKTRMMAESQEVIEQKQETDQTFRESANEVKQTVFEQIKATGQYMQDEARTMSTLAQAFYITKAAEMGIQPKELYDRIPYRVVSGEMQTEGQVLQQQGKDAPIFYSQLEKVIREAKHLKMPGKQWSLWLKSNAPKLGVKADEMQAVDIEEFLELKGNDKVTRQEIEEYLRQNGVRVEEVIKGSKDERYALGSARLKFVMEQNPIQVQELKEVGLEPFIDTDGNIYVVLFKDVEYGNFYDYEEVQSMSEFSNDVGQVAQMIAEEYVEGATEPIPFPTKYPMLTLPWGDEYRELLLTLPSKRKNQYKSSHWDEPDVLAHIRFNAHTGADGKKVLFIEEIQSDWGQEGKKKGFAQDVNDVKERQNKLEAELVEKYGEAWRLKSTPQENAQWDEYSDMIRGAEEGVQSAPFVTETKAWVGLAIKRMIRYATEGGYDKVAFINGEQSAERYDLTKVVSELAYWKDGGETWGVSLLNTKGRPIYGWNPRDGMTVDELEANISEEITQKIVNDEGDSNPEDSGYFEDDKLPEGVSVIQEDGLKVGGEGMKAFYDKIVPFVANKIVKKYGAKVGETEIKTRFKTAEKPDEKMFREASNDAHDSGDTRSAVLLSDTADKLAENPYMEIPGWIVNPNEPASKYIDKLRGDIPEETSQPSIDITQEMKQSVMQGQPLFQGDRKDPRGGFAPQRLTTILNKKADFSTYVHETGHFYLEALSRVAAMPEATAHDKADMQALLEWFGVENLDAWNALSLEEQRKHHEAFAYNFELYMFEGKAPSLKLQQVFDRFRKWLLRVYRSIREELNDAYKQENGTDLPILTGEVREVMDRMLASEEDIRLAEQVQSMKPLFDERALTQMTAEQVEEYQAAQQEAHDNAVSDLSKASLRQMKWLSNARSKILKDLQKKANAERKQIRYEVTAEVLREPVYKAMTELKKGDGDLKIKLSDAQELAGENWRKLGTGRFGMIRRDGQPVDFVAEIFGFDSGDAMVKALLDARPMKEVIAEKTDLRMKNEFSELVDPKQKEEAVQKSLHNEARARFVAVELRALANALSPVRVLTAAAKQTAKTLVEQRQVKDLRPHVHTVAEAKAARQAEAEMKKGLTMAAAQSKRRQLLQNHMASESIAAKEFVEKARKYFKRLQSDVSRKRMGADAGDQIDALLERFGLKSLGSYVERQSLAEWLNVQEDIGRLPEIAQSLQNESYQRDYRELSFAEFVDLHDAIRQIEHIGRNERKLLSAAKEIEYEKARDEIVTSINANARGRKAETRAPTTSFGRFKKGYERFKASHLKASAIARILDGGKDGGPVWEYLIRPANKAGNKEVVMRADATIRLSDIIVPVLKAGKMGGKGKMFPSINRSLNREQVFAIALNTGNASNIQRLTSGEGWTMEQVMPVLESLTEAELQAVQEVWDFFESYRPQIAEKERRVFGREPKWIEPQTITIKSADGKDVGLRGGYYPVVYDPAASQRAEAYAEAEQAKLDMKGAFTSATTRRSFTKTRRERVVGRPLLYNLAGMYNGANEVIHDLSWHEFLIDANRLLRSHGIDEAIRTQYGPEWKSQLKQWVKDVAVGERMAMRSGEEIIGKIRQNISAAGLGFNAVSAAIQLLGFNQSVVRVGAKWIAKGVSQATANPLQAIKDVRSKSEFMAHRGRTQFRELNEIRNMVQGESLAKKRVKMGTYLFIVKMQQLVDVPTWIGAYEKALFEGNGEKRAIALADQAVIDSQASGMIKDLSAIERGGPAMKLFTVFYTYMNTVFNMATVSKMTAKSKGKLVADMLMIFVVPVVFDRIIRDAVTPDTDEDEWDWSKVARRFAADELEYLMGTMFLVRELTYISETLTGAEGPRFGYYSGPAGLRLLDDIGTFATQASQLEFDRAFVRSAINLIGSGTGLPSAQINRTIKGAEALLEEETKNPAALIFGAEEK